MINLGRTTAEDIVIRVGASIKDKDSASLLIDGVPADYDIHLASDFTDFSIKKIKKGQSVLISFIPTAANGTYFDVAPWSNESGREEIQGWAPESWEFNNLQKSFIFAFLILGVLFGYLVGKTRRHRTR